MTIIYEYELEKLRKIGRIVGQTLLKMKESARVGMSTQDLDEVGAKILLSFGARSAPQLVYGFPGATCISVNEEIAHGVPGDRVFQPGDLVNIDVSAELDGFFADTGCSFVLPPIAPEKEAICFHTRSTLFDLLSKISVNTPLRDIGENIENSAKGNGYKPIRNLGSHGVGRALHEIPDFIPGSSMPDVKGRLNEGLVVALEPFFSTKTDFAEEADDGWTLKGPKGNLSAQFEHTILITKNRPIILTHPY